MTTVLYRAYNRAASSCLPFPTLGCEGGRSEGRENPVRSLPLSPGIVAPIGLPLVALISGMVWGWYLPHWRDAFLICTTVGTIAALAFFVIDKRVGWRTLPILVLILFLFAQRTSLRLNPEFPPDHLIHQAAGKAVFLEGVLYEQPRVFRNFTSLPLEARRIRSRQGCRPVRGRVDLFLGQKDRDLRVGDVLLLEATIRRWRDPTNPGQRHSKSLSFLKRIYVKGNVKDRKHLVRVGVADGYGFRRWIQDIRDRLARFLDQEEDPASRGLMKACFLGDRSELSEAMVAAFRCSGLSHLLAISGLHVGLAGLFAYVVLKSLFKRSKILLLRYSVTKLAALGSLPMVDRGQ